MIAGLTNPILAVADRLSIKLQSFASPDALVRDDFGTRRVFANGLSQVTLQAQMRIVMLLRIGSTSSTV